MIANLVGLLKQFSRFVDLWKICKSDAVSIVIVIVIIIITIITLLMIIRKRKRTTAAIIIMITIRNIIVQCFIFYT